jgi:uncharacterized protein YjbJ (UPF0337 family)
MVSERTKGTVSQVRGKVEEELGKVTGDRGQQVKGKVRQIQGSAQHGLGNIQGAAHVHKTSGTDTTRASDIPSGSDRPDRRG